MTEDRTGDTSATPEPTDPTGLAPDVRPITDRPHGGVRDPEHAEFFDIENRNLRDPDAERMAPERKFSTR